MHLSSETALTYLEGRLDQDQEGFWRRHLTACVECAQEVQVWRELKIDLKRRHLESAPESDLENAFRIWTRQPASARGTLRKILATVTFDSFSAPALAGARGTDQVRQLVMRGDEFDIHIKVWGEPSHRQMIGQLLPRNREGFIAARFHLLHNGERLETTKVDELGEFRFTDVPEGDLSLQIDLPNLTIIGPLRNEAAR